MGETGVSGRVGAGSGTDGDLRDLVESASVAVLVAQDERVVYANEKASELTGCSPASLPGQPVMDFVHPDDRLSHAEESHRCLAGHQGGGGWDMRLVTRAGDAHWVRCIATEARWRGRPAALLVLGVLSDEGRALDQPQSSEARFRTLLDNVHDAIFIHDMAGNFLEVNAVACSRLGYTREELMALKIADINVEDQGPEIPKRLQRIAREGHIIFETEHLRRDGTSFPTEISSRLYRYGDTPAMLSVARDITERRRLQQELVQAQKMESIGLLAGGIAHDFNNHLGAILGLASLIARQTREGEAANSYAQSIEESARRAADLTVQLLAIARKAEPRMRAVDLNELVRGTLELVARTFDRAISVDVRYAEGAPSVRGDSSQLAQAVMNLCLNARDAMPHGGELRVSTELRSLTSDEARRMPAAGVTRAVVLAVEDTGHGIAKEHQQLVFDPFFTTKEPGKGTGLGLSTVFSVVKNHSGFCAMTSEPGAGAAFRLFLPAHAHEEIPAEVEARGPRGSGELVLVVDDEERLRLACGQMLQDYGYDVVLASNGQAAVDVYRDRGEEIDLVLLDIIMPRMGGRRCLAELIELDPEVKAVMVSGYGLSPGEELRSLGAIGYLQKPFGVDQLLVAVREALDGNDGQSCA